MNEFSIIEKLRKQFSITDKSIVVGIGDDAAVLQGGLLVSCDVQVEGVHFKQNAIAPEKLGQKAVAVALSDIAAMGGVPQFLLLSLGIPQKTDEAFITSLFEGIGKACRQYQINLVGGNLSQANTLFIDCFVLGRAVIKPVTRKGAKPGDVVLLTGMLGKAAFRYLDEFKSRIKEGQIIARSRFATAMIDISDGLSTDLLHLCDASSVGVRILAKEIPRVSLLERALNGGEDYELCFTASPKHARQLSQRIKRKTGTDVTIIGEILPKKGGRWIIDEDGRNTPLEAKGWNHLRS